MWRFLGKFIAQSIDMTTCVSRKWTRTPISGILKCYHSLIYSKTYFKTISTCEHMYGLREKSALENHRTGTASYLIIVHSSFTYPLTGLSSVRCVKGTFHPCTISFSLRSVVVVGQRSHALLHCRPSHVFHES